MTKVQNRVNQSVRVREDLRPPPRPPLNAHTQCTAYLAIVAPNQRNIQNLNVPPRPPIVQVGSTLRVPRGAERRRLGDESGVAQDPRARSVGGRCGVADRVRGAAEFRYAGGCGDGALASPVVRVSGVVVRGGSGEGFTAKSF